MPRLTPQDYLARRQFLMELWFDHDGGPFTVVPTKMQRDLHDFFAPSEGLTDTQVLAHRKEITKAFPSLPQSAGRACETVLAHHEGRPNKTVEDPLAFSPVNPAAPGKPYRMQVLFQDRPKIDHWLLARAFIELSRTEYGKKVYEEIQAKKAREEVSGEQ